MLPTADRSARITIMAHLLPLHRTGSQKVKFNRNFRRDRLFSLACYKIENRQQSPSIAQRQHQCHIGPRISPIKTLDGGLKVPNPPNTVTLLHSSIIANLAAYLNQIGNFKSPYRDGNERSPTEKIRPRNTLCLYIFRTSRQSNTCSPCDNHAHKERTPTRMPVYRPRKFPPQTVLASLS
jgi:hypothetical protein